MCRRYGKTARDSDSSCVGGTFTVGRVTECLRSSRIWAIVKD